MNTADAERRRQSRTRLPEPQVENHNRKQGKGKVCLNFAGLEFTTEQANETGQVCDKIHETINDLVVKPSHTNIKHEERQSGNTKTEKTKANHTGNSHGRR